MNNVLNAVNFATNAAAQRQQFAVADAQLRFEYEVFTSLAYLAAAIQDLEVVVGNIQKLQMEERADRARRDAEV